MGGPSNVRYRVGRLVAYPEAKECAPDEVIAMYLNDVASKTRAGQWRSVQCRSVDDALVLATMALWLRKFYVKMRQTPAGAVVYLSPGRPGPPVGTWETLRVLFGRRG